MKSFRLPYVTCGGHKCRRYFNQKWQWLSGYWLIMLLYDKLWYFFIYTIGKVMGNLIDARSFILHKHYKIKLITSLLSDNKYSTNISNAAITIIAIRLRCDYDPTTMYRARLLPIRRKQKWTCQFFVVVESQFWYRLNKNYRNKEAKSIQRRRIWCSKNERLDVCLSVPSTSDPYNQK